MEWPSESPEREGDTARARKVFCLQFDSFIYFKEVWYNI